MTQDQANALRDTFVRELGADVELEQVSRAGRYRFALTSPRFEGMAHLARQDLIWPFVDQVLPREATLDVSMILAFAPSELTEVED